MADADVSSGVRADHVVVVLRGELDICNTAGVARVLAAAAASRPQIIVDLAELAFMDCGGLRVLVSAWAQARKAGGDLLLAAPQPIVLRLLSVIGLTDLVPVFASAKEAVSSAGWAAPVRCFTPELAGGEAASEDGDAWPAASRCIATSAAQRRGGHHNQQKWPDEGDTDLSAVQQDPGGRCAEPAC